MDDKLLIISTNRLARLLTKRSKFLSVAESCTGGWIAKVLTDLSGSSAWFERGFVTYSNQAKQDMLGVSASIIESFGAVSQETVEAMAIGALTHSQADFSLSVSGIAGPSGGSAGKPVGLVWFAWAKKDPGRNTLLATEQHIFSGDREAVRAQAVVHALSRLIDLIEDQQN
jgi:nicotinamide-nucleotide amidase